MLVNKNGDSENMIYPRLWIILGCDFSPSIPLSLLHHIPKYSIICFHGDEWGINGTCTVLSANLFSYTNKKSFKPFKRLKLPSSPTFTLCRISPLNSYTSGIICISIQWSGEVNALLMTCNIHSSSNLTSYAFSIKTCWISFTKSSIFSLK